MAYTNHILFNNIFLKNLNPTEEEIVSANYLVHENARGWYRNADFSSPLILIETWIKPLLNQQTLDLVEADPGDPSVWYLVAPWDRETPLALCYVVGEHQRLDGFATDGSLPKGQHWMIQAVNLALQRPELNLRWVILTNGDQWRLLDAHSLRRYEAYLEIDLVDLLKGQDDRLAATLFYHIVRLEDSLERDESSGKNKLDAFLEQSIQATEATEKYLKTGVSDNLNTPGGGDGIMAQLCMGLVHAIDPSLMRAFTDAERDEIYRNATYLLYRLLFIFYAEARNLLPMDREAYHAISLDRLVEEAKAVHLYPGVDSMQQTSLWDQLNTLFNAIQYSDEYVGVPPYNGGLFENDDKAYLGKYKLANRFLGEALFELAYLTDAKGETPAERIDYRDLSVRHLGSLYEGMIEYRLFIAEEDLLARRDKDGKVQYLKAAACDRKSNDEVLRKGKVYFAQSPHERKSTGTHYTAEDLVERLVKQTVLRLLNERWQEFEPKLNQWLAEIEATPSGVERRRMQARVDSELEQFVQMQVLVLRACDPAMGSGHFLVYIAHQMTNFVLWVLSRTPWANPAVNLDADVWRKRIVENCLYGVDINQMAVELAKLSLWLATMQLGQPLSFLDYHLKQGNSLLGASLEEIEALLKRDDFSKQTVKSAVEEAKGQYLLVSQVRQIQQKMGEANTLVQKIASQIVTRAEDIHQQELDYEEVEKVLAPYKRIGDLIVVMKMGLKIPDNELNSLVKTFENRGELTETQNQWRIKTQELLNDMQTLHWGLEFPHIFWENSQEGFDIVVGNPPFLGGYKIRGELGSNFTEYLRKAYSHANGQADLSAYMFRKAFEIAKVQGYLGMVATNTIGQGDTRSSGIAVLLQQNGVIVYTDRYVTWAGDASVEVNLIAIKKAESQYFPAKKYLDGKIVPFISSWLDDLPELEPSRLARNKNLAFIGDALRGMGFILSSLEAGKLLRNSENSDCILPYLSGDDLNSDPEQKPSRHVICFRDMVLEKAKEYPELIKIVEERVKPIRDKVAEKHDKENWWLFARYRGELRKAIESLNTVLTRAVVSDTHAIVFMPKTMIFNHKVVVFAFDDAFHFSILQSKIHELWMRRYTSTMRTDTNYSVSDCFVTYPFPPTPSQSDINKTTKVGSDYHKIRQLIMRARGLGLTKIYNLFNNPLCQEEDIKQLRSLQIEMDCSILTCYGWEDIDLQYDFYPNDRKKIRFMPSLAAQRETFTRLIALNQEIASQEVEEGISVEVDKEDEA